MLKKKNLALDTDYEFRIGTADGHVSEPVIVRLNVSDGLSPAPPVVVSVELTPEDASKAIATVKWDAPGNATQFELQFRPVDGVSGWTTASDSLAKPEVRKKNLNGSVAYAFRWRGLLDGKSWGPWSLANAPAQAPPPARALTRMLAPKLLSQTGWRDAQSLSRKVIAL